MSKRLRYRVGWSEKSKVFKRRYKRNNCAPFCAHPRSISVAIGSRTAGAEIACTGAENQHDSKLSQSLTHDLATTDKGEVGGSSPPRPTKPSKCPKTVAQGTRKQPIGQAHFEKRNGNQPRQRASDGNFVRGVVLHRWYRALGIAVLLRFHGEAVRVDAVASDFGKCAEQADRRAGVWIHGWLAGGPVRAAARDDGWDLAGRSGAVRAGRNLVAQAVLLFLFPQCARVRRRRAAAESGVAIAMV